MKTRQDKYSVVKVLDDVTRTIEAVRVIERDRVVGHYDDEPEQDIERVVMDIRPSEPLSENSPVVVSMVLAAEVFISAMGRDDE